MNSPSGSTMGFWVMSYMRTDGIDGASTPTTVKSRSSSRSPAWSRDGRSAWPGPRP